MSNLRNVVVWLASYYSKYLKLEPAYSVHAVSPKINSPQSS